MELEEGEAGCFQSDRDSHLQWQGGKGLCDSQGT